MVRADQSHASQATVQVSCSGLTLCLPVVLGGGVKLMGVQRRVEDVRRGQNRWKIDLCVVMHENECLEASQRVRRAPRRRDGLNDIAIAASARRSLRALGVLDVEIPRREDRYSNCVAVLDVEHRGRADLVQSVREVGFVIL